MIRGHQPDVALVDVSMPGLDGIDVVAELARQGPDVPVVLLSAHSDAALVGGSTAGAAAYVTKAASREEILAAISRAAGPHGLEG